MLNLKQKMMYSLLVSVIFWGLTVTAYTANANDLQIVKHQPIVAKLITLLDAKPELKSELESSIQKADVLGIYTLEEYYAFLDEMVVWIPTGRMVYQKLVEFYYLIDHSDVLKESPAFNEWVNAFSNDWGNFLDTPASAKALSTFYNNPDPNLNFNLDDYFVGPSGWMTFNQFFAREIKPGKRPVAKACNNQVIVSPADTHFVEWLPINKDGNITVKVKGIEMTYSIPELLGLAEYQDDPKTIKLKNSFNGGTFMHAFLNVDDYHRFHTPVGGKIVYKANISGKMILDVEKNPLTGALHAMDGTGYQFSQQRGLIIIDSDDNVEGSKGIGLVAVLPIGMAQVSSVTLTPDVGDTLRKGEEFGFFQFGGSDIVMVFQKDKVEIDAIKNNQYLQGTRIGTGH